MQNKVFIAGALSLSLLALCSCGAVSGSAAASDQTVTESATEETAAPALGAFRDQEWGSSLESVQAAVITPSMVQGSDYELGQEGDYTGLALVDCPVGGHASAAAFLFYDDALSFGQYMLSNMDDEVYADLLSKYTEQYGEPAKKAASTGWGPCSVWVDQEKNYVVISRFLGQVVYVSAGSPYTDTLAEILGKDHGVDLPSLLDQVGNMDGI